MKTCCCSFPSLNVHVRKMFVQQLNKWLPLKLNFPPPVHCLLVCLWPDSDGREMASCQSGFGENINIHQLLAWAKLHQVILVDWLHQQEIDLKSFLIFKKMSKLRHISWICTSCVQSLEIDFSDQKNLKIKLLMKCFQTFYSD